MRESFACLLVLAAACGNDVRPEPACVDPPGPFPEGNRDGHPQPLLAGPNQARAGRVHDGDLPPVPSGLITWKPGDFVLANDKVAIVIEDVGDSDLYDPWGGKPVGLARISGGKLIEPNNFGELFLLTGRSTVVADSVTVLADGSDGGPAIIRARGKLHPLPFFDSIIKVVFGEAFTDIDAALDYQLAPGSDHVDILYRYASARDSVTSAGVMHAFMYTARTPVYVPGGGFSTSLGGAPYLALVDDQATSWGYIPAQPFGSSISVSGFVGSPATNFDMPACGTLDRPHAQIVIGGPGLDGVLQAIGRVRNEAQRVITGTVTRTGGGPAAGVRVHAIDLTGDAYLTRATTDSDGKFTLHVPAAANVRLDAYRTGEAIVSSTIGAATTGDIALPALGHVHVTATEGATKMPVRIQILPVAGAAATVPDRYGEPRILSGRQLVAFAMSGDVTLDVPVGSWEIIVSRGYEYELVRQTVTVTANATATVDALLDRAVDTTGVQCGDFHIHTWRSNDSGDDALEKVRQAVADGVELPVRSDHEYVADFSSEIQQLGVGAFANGMGSIELTSFEVWGHMGVFPLVPDAAAVNAGAPKWQTFPTAASPATKFETLSPPKVFDTVRARPESPIVIINHPRGGANYFDYVGFDPATGLANVEGEWDTKFTLVEVFNDSDWLANRTKTVRDWLGLLHSGRKVFAVGSSDSHGLVNSPVGYPRTCIAVGTDDPRQLTQNLVRDRLAAGHATVSGGIYVTARLGTAGPGDTVTGAGSPMGADVTVRAATWVDVTSLEVVVDGQTVDTIPIMPGDADPTDKTIRFHKQVTVQPAATGGFVVFAAYGSKPLEPVHPGRIPFGVTNPIFVAP